MAHSFRCSPCCLRMSAAVRACAITGLGAAVLAVATPANADPFAAINGIGVYSKLRKQKRLAPGISVFLAGYLSNVKNYSSHSLDQYYVKTEEEALMKGVELQLDALLVAELDGIRSHENGAVTDFRLLKADSGKLIRKWSARIETPYFDPPSYRQIRPYGNLDEVFADFPLKQYESSRVIKTLVVTDQRIRGSGRAIKEFLLSQLEVASRVLQREFGIELQVTDVRRWSPPDADIHTISVAAATIPGRGKEEVDLTLVCVGQPALTCPRRLSQLS